MCVECGISCDPVRCCSLTIDAGSFFGLSGFFAIDSEYGPWNTARKGRSSLACAARFPLSFGPIGIQESSLRYALPTRRHVLTVALLGEYDKQIGGDGAWR